MSKYIEKSFRNSFVCGLIKIVDGIVQVLSLGLLYSSLSMWHTEWRCRRNIRQMQQKNRAGA